MGKNCENARAGLALLLALALLAFAGCGGGDEPPAGHEPPPGFHLEQDARAEPPSQAIARHDEGAEDEEEPPAPPPGPEWGEPVRGMWRGNVWVSEYMALHFNMPHGWGRAGDEEIAVLAGIGGDMVFEGEDIPAEWWEDAVMYDLMAIHLETGSSVQVLFERMESADAGAEDFVAALAGMLPELGISAGAAAPPREIGGESWTRINASTDAAGGGTEMSYFVRVVDGFAWVIIITQGHGSDGGIDAYAELFGHFGDAPMPTWRPHGTLAEMYSVPPLGQPDDSHPLVGEWAWEFGAEYVLVFRGDGTGERGIPGMMEEFRWEIEGPHLAIRVGLAAESWTFFIAGDALSIASRQIEELEFGYVRQ